MRHPPQTVRLLACWDDPGARRASEAVENEPFATETYGMEGTRFWQATDLHPEADAIEFTLRRAGAALGGLRATVPADHFVRNVTAAAGVCLGLGVPFEAVAAAVAKFQGARRRFETVGQAGGIRIMDHYAHHPT